MQSEEGIDVYIHTHTHTHTGQIKIWKSKRGKAVLRACSVRHAARLAPALSPATPNVNLPGRTPSSLACSCTWGTVSAFSIMLVATKDISHRIKIQQTMEWMWRIT